MSGLRIDTMDSTINVMVRVNNTMPIIVTNIDDKI